MNKKVSIILSTYNEALEIIETINKITEFIPVRIDVDKQQDIAEEYNANARKHGGIGIPNILFLDKENNLIRQIVGFHNVDQLMRIMDSVLMKLY